jgi:RNase H-like domain found in reverse transcriptase
LGKNIVLTFCDFEKPFEIYTNASKVQLGAVTEQGGKHLAFYSRKLNDAQTHYTVAELELLSIVETLQEYCTNLLGHIIKAYTDHKNFTFNNFTTDCVRRWRLIVKQYGPKITYINGCKNVVADTLSRYPHLEETLPDKEEVFVAEEEQDTFPLLFTVISKAQQNDEKLLRLAHENQDYQTKPCFSIPSSTIKTKALSHKLFENALSNGTTPHSFFRVSHVPLKASVNIFIGVNYQPTWRTTVRLFVCANITRNKRISMIPYPPKFTIQTVD